MRRSVIKLDAVASARVDEASAVAAALLLVLFLGEALALGDDQILVRLATPVVGVVREAVRLELVFDINVFLDARKGLVLLLNRRGSSFSAVVLLECCWVRGQRRIWRRLAHRHRGIGGGGLFLRGRAGIGELGVGGLF